ncbi:MAG: DUF4157 domain-containing protein [Aliiglaciecola sp.]|uniref:eCIS core domain-containing protein n=1 Tax=Aliiglaciecola sp. TaxID=1872441 RepID=UPI00329918D6
MGYKSLQKQSSAQPVAAENSKSHPAPAATKANPLWCKLALNVDRTAPRGVQRKKITVGAANDIFEQQADAVANAVVGKQNSSSPTISSATTNSLQKKLKSEDEESLQRKCEACESEEENLQRKADTLGNVAPSANVQSAVNSPGIGSHLSQEVRNKIEPVLGADLSSVRVHNNSQSQRAAKDIHALAFTYHNNIFLGAGQSQNDLGLMAHEATHVLQQSGQGNLLQRQDTGSSARGAWQIGRYVFNAGVDWVEKEVPGGRLATNAARSLYNSANPLISRGRHLAERITEESVFGAAGDSDLRSITFNGAQVSVVGNPGFSAPAVSGLQSHARNARGIDYTDPLYQDQLNLGPIPEGEYYVIPSEVQSSSTHNFSQSSWGHYRVILHPTLLTYQHRVILRRGGGFYLHQDANNNGTAGCIGLIKDSDNRRLLERIRDASGPVPVTVRYSQAPLEQSRQEANEDCPSCEPAALTRSITHPNASTATHSTPAEGAWAAALIALDPNGGEILVTGEALRRVRENKGTRRAWHQLMRQLLSYRFNNRAGIRSTFFRPKKAIAYGGNYFDPSDYFTTGTWLIGHCFPTAQLQFSYCRDSSGSGLRGIVHAVWVIHDDLDLEPGQGRGAVYNTGARILTRVWHDTLGGRRTAPVYVTWEESRGFCLSDSGQLTFYPVS